MLPSTQGNNFDACILDSTQTAQRITSRELRPLGGTTGRAMTYLLEDLPQARALGNFSPALSSRIRLKRVPSTNMAGIILVLRFNARLLPAVSVEEVHIQLCPLHQDLEVDHRGCHGRTRAVPHGRERHGGL